MSDYQHPALDTANAIKDAQQKGADTSQYTTITPYKTENPTFGPPPESSAQRFGGFLSANIDVILLLVIFVVVLFVAAKVAKRSTTK